MEENKSLALPTIVKVLTYIFIFLVVIGLFYNVNDAETEPIEITLFNIIYAIVHLLALIFILNKNKWGFITLIVLYFISSVLRYYDGDIKSLCYKIIFITLYSSALLVKSNGVSGYEILFSNKEENDEEE